MTIREYTLNLLKECGCKNNAYENQTVEQATEDLQWYEGKHGKLPFHVEDVARELVLIGNHEHLEPVPVHDLRDEFDDWGRWGIDDPYPETEKILRDALANDELFDTGYHGWVKTEGSMCVVKRYDEIVVSCAKSMDSALEEYDLFSDFLTNEELEMLDAGEVTDVEQIRGLLIWGDYVEEIDYNEKLPVTATYEEIMEKAKKLMQDCDDRLTESFHECISTTLYCLYPDMDPKELTDFISDRIEEVDA